MLCWPENSWDNKVFDASFKVTQTCFVFCQHTTCFKLCCLSFFLSLLSLCSLATACVPECLMCLWCTSERIFGVEFHPHSKVEPVNRNEYLLSAYVTITEHRCLQLIDVIWFSTQTTNLKFQGSTKRNQSRKRQSSSQSRRDSLQLTG